LPSAQAAADEVGSDLGRARLSGQRRETATLDEPPPLTELAPRGCELPRSASSAHRLQEWQHLASQASLGPSHSEAQLKHARAEARIKARAAAAVGTGSGAGWEREAEPEEDFDAEEDVAAAFAEAQARARAEARARRRAAEEAGRKVKALDEEAAQRVQVDQQVQSQAEAAALLAKKRRHIQELEADVAQRSKAVEDLTADIASADRAVEASRAHALQLHRRYQAVAAADGPMLEELEARVAQEQREAASWTRAAEELHHIAEVRPMAERQRLHWLEQAAGLEYELRECHRQLGPLSQEVEVLNRLVELTWEERRDLEGQLSELEEAFSEVGVDVWHLRHTNGSIEELELILALCVAILPEQALVPAGAAKRLEGGGSRPPLVPAHVPTPQQQYAARRGL